MVEKRQQSSRYPGCLSQPYVCEDCGTRFTRRPDMDRHITPKVKCPKDVCKKLYRADKMKEFLSHIEKKHPELDYGACKKIFQGHKARACPLPGLCIGKDATEPTTQPHHTNLSQHMQSHVPIMPAFEKLDINDIDADIDHDYRTWGNAYGGIPLEHRSNASSALQAKSEYDFFSNATPLANYGVFPTYFDYCYDPSLTYLKFTQSYQLGPSSSYTGFIYTLSPHT